MYKILPLRNYTDVLSLPVHTFRKYYILWKYKNLPSLYMMMDKAEAKKTVAIIIEAEADGYMVSMLNTAAGDMDSYVETRVDSAHPLYSRVHEIAAILNIAATADEEKEIEGVGTSHGQGIYSAFINADEAKLLL
jgi:hypothetical protein